MRGLITPILQQDAVPSCLSDAERQLTSLHATPLLPIIWALNVNFAPDSSLKDLEAGLRVGRLLPWPGGGDKYNRGTITSV